MDLDLLAESESDSDSDAQSQHENSVAQRSTVTAATAGSDPGTSQRRAAQHRHGGDPGTSQRRAVRHCHRKLFRNSGSVTERLLVTAQA